MSDRAIAILGLVLKMCDASFLFLPHCGHFTVLLLLLYSCSAVCLFILEAGLITNLFLEDNFLVSLNSALD